MTKRILSLLLALMMVLGSIIVVSAAEEEIDYDVENAFAIDVLKDINVLQGYDEDDFALDAAIKRYEMSLFIARALTGKTKDTYWEGAKNETPFTDLDGFKYAGSTTWTYNHGIILGKDNKTFDPNGYITYQEAIAMVLRAWADYYVEGGLKTLKIDDSIHYPWRHIELVEYLGLDANIDPETKYTDVLTRGQVAQLIFNLLTWKLDPNDTYLSAIVEKTTTMAEDKYGLSVSGSEGVLVAIDDEKANAADHETMPNWLKNTIWAWNNDKFDKVDNGEDIYDIDALTPDHFAEFEVEVEEDVYFNIVYYTRREVKENPFTGEVSFPENGKIETVILSITKVSIDDLIYTNAVGATPEYTIQVEAAKTSDNKDGKAIVSITAGDVAYPVIGENALNVRFMTDIDVFNNDGKGYDASKFGSYNKEGALVGLKGDDIDKLVKELTPVYADLRVEDTDGDGEVDTLTIVPYVFASVYTEAETEKADDGKTTTWSFVNYAVVLLDKTQKSGTTFAILNKDGNDATQTITAQTTYIAKDSAKSAAAATVVAEAGVITGYDVRTGKTNYIKVDGESYSYKYEALKGWSFGGDYYKVAADSNTLFALYDMKDVDDELLGNRDKYVKVWVLDGNIVAMVKVDVEGEVIDPSDKEEDTTTYTGVIDFDTIPSVATTDDAEIKKIEGKYYLVVDAIIDGYVQEDILIYLGAIDPLAQKASENEKVKTAVDSIINAVGANKLAFYNLDSLGNVIVPNDGKGVNAKVNHEVTPANYSKYIGVGAKVELAKNSDKTAYVQDVSAIEYTMGNLAEGYIKYTIKETGKVDTVETKTFAVNAQTEWLFIDVANATATAFVGVPEFDSTFTTVDLEKDPCALLVKDNKVVVFVASMDGFEYSMYEDAVYALADNTIELLDKGVRDGNLYFKVKDFMTGGDMEIVVPETTELAETLKALDANATNECKLIAVTAGATHKMLESYNVDEKALTAIAMLNAMETTIVTGFESKADLEDDIADAFNMTTIGQILMSDKDNVYYTVDSTGKIMKKQSGMPLVDATAKAIVFYTPASGDKAAGYTVVLYNVATTLTADMFEKALDTTGTNTTKVNVAVNEDVTVANVLTLTADTTINIADGKTLTIGGIKTNGHDLTINGGTVVGTAASVYEDGLWTGIITATNKSVVTLKTTAVETTLNPSGVVVKDSTLKVIGSTVTNNMAGSGEIPDAIRAFGNSVVDIENVTINSKEYKSAVKVTAGVAAGACGVELYDAATLNLKKGTTIEAYSGVVVYGGTANISGTVKATEAISVNKTDGNNPATSVKSAVVILNADAVVEGTNEAIWVNKAPIAAAGSTPATVVKVEIKGATVKGEVLFGTTAAGKLQIDVTADSVITDYDNNEKINDVANPNYNGNLFKVATGVAIDTTGTGSAG